MLCFLALVFFMKAVAGMGSRSRRLGLETFQRLVSVLSWVLRVGLDLVSDKLVNVSVSRKKVSCTSLYVSGTVVSVTQLQRTRERRL